MVKRHARWSGAGLVLVLGLAGLAGAPLAAQTPAAAAPDAAVAPATSASTSASAAAAQAGPASPPYGQAVLARYPDPPVRYTVPALQPGRQVPTSQQELDDWLTDTVAMAPPGTRIERLVPGQSQLGVPIPALRFSRGPGRPLVLLVGQQHGDEPAGAEALLVLARELAQGPLAAVLDRLDVVMVPRLNVDGALWGSRVSANGMDINRDHLLLRTPEARALAALARPRRPVLAIDSHEYSVIGRYLAKFNAIQRHDLLFQHATVANQPVALAEATEAWFRQPLLAALANEGHRVEWYYTNPTTPGNLRLSMGGVQPDVGRNVYGLRHAVSLLLESRGVGLGHWHLGRRIHSQVVALRTALQQAAAQADALVALQARADAEVAALACRGSLVVQAATTPMRRELLMVDPDTGADKPLQVDWDSALQLRVLRERPRPCGYWLAADQALAVATLQALGLQVRRFTADAPLRTEAWVELDRTEVARPDVRGQAADGGQSIVRLVVALQPEAFTAPAGSYYLPLDQPLAHLATAALEPDTPSSYRANGLIVRLDAARRVMVRPEDGR